MKRFTYCFAIVTAAVCMGLNCAAAGPNPLNPGEAGPSVQNQDEGSAGRKDGTKKDYRTATFVVSMTCQNCVNKISENIGFEKGVKGLDIRLESRTVSVIYDASKTDEEKIAAALRKLGYEVTPVSGGEDGGSGDGQR